MNTTADNPHRVTAEWDEPSQTWWHTCLRCGQVTLGWAPELPCPATEPHPQQVPLPNYADYDDTP